MTGAELIAQERQRQITEEGWTAEHDAQHQHDELVWAAMYYALPHVIWLGRGALLNPSKMFNETGWDAKWAKRSKKTRKQQLI